MIFLFSINVPFPIFQLSSTHHIYIYPVHAVPGLESGGHAPAWGGVPFCMPGHAGLDVFSPARHIRRGGEDRGGRGSWKGGSWSPLSLPSAEDCTRMSEIKYICTYNVQTRAYVCMFCGSARTCVCTHIYVHVYAQCIRVQTVCT